MKVVSKQLNTGLRSCPENHTKYKRLQKRSDSPNSEICILKSKVIHDKTGWFSRGGFPPVLVLPNRPQKSELKVTLLAMASQANSDVVAVGIGQRLLRDYFQLFRDTRAELLRFYAPEAILAWNGEQFRGVEEIRGHIETLPQLSFQPTSYTVSPITKETADTLVVMVVITGTMAGAGRVTDYHSTFYVEWNEQQKSCLIRYQTFDS